MKKIILLIALLCIWAFIAWKNTHPPSFTIETRKGQKIHATELRYQVYDGLDSMSGAKKFTLHLPFGSFKVPKDLKDIQRIEVLDESANTLKVTDSSKETLEGTRTNDPKEHLWDWIEGESGKVHVYLPTTDVISITRD